MFKNYGDICLIDGGKVEAVDCVNGGGHCQNLSVAGYLLVADLLTNTNYS